MRERQGEHPSSGAVTVLHKSGRRDLCSGCLQIGAFIGLDRSECIIISTYYQLETSVLNAKKLNLQSLLIRIILYYRTKQETLWHMVRRK